MTDIFPMPDCTDSCAPLAQVLGQLPQYSAKVALVAPEYLELPYSDRETVWFVTDNESPDAPRLSASLLCSTARLPIPAGSLDAVVLDLRPLDATASLRMLRRLMPCASRNVRVHLLVSRPMSWADIQSTLDACNLVRYLAWRHDGADFVCTEDRFNEGVAVSPEDALEVESVFDTHAAPCWLVTAVRRQYDPLEHAASLIPFPAPENGLLVLEGAPMRLFPIPDRFARANLLAQLAHLAWDTLDLSHRALNHFARAQRFFYMGTALRPDMLEAYQTQASFWSRIGRPDMAASILRTGQAFCREPLTAEPVAPLVSRMCPPPLSAEHRFNRILLLTSQYVDYGNDTLFDGLWRVLGEDGVVEYPWKPTLHGHEAQMAKGYPCTFNYPGNPLPVPEIVAQINDGRFDALIFADVLAVDDPERRPILEAARHLPVFVLDTGDECGYYWQSIMSCLGHNEIAGFFKREMLVGVEYGPSVMPMPFAYPEDRLSVDILRPSWNTRRTRPLFWAGNRNIGLRRTYLAAVESALGLSLTEQYTQEEYLTALRESRISLCLFGLGFDTVRYWESAAQGAMLMANRPPIHIPHNFLDGESAVFFDDLPDLLDKLGYYLSRPEETLAIAQAGHALLREHHTTRARAQQFLAWMGMAL